MNLDLSIIIPTHNRIKILLQALDCISNQDYDLNKIEVIIIDDASTDETKDQIQNYKNQAKLKIKYFYQNKKGQGIARNLGIKKANGKIILFIGDDIFLEKSALSRHMEIHKNHPHINHACLGFIDWDPNLEITPFMKWLTNGSCILGKYGGHQFAFEKLINKKKANYNFFYTSNISLKKKLLIQENFDSTFSKYGWEDIELGYRLTKKNNLIIHYQNKAKAYHHHQIDENTLEPRMKMIASSAKIIEKKHPELKKIPSTKKIIIFKCISSIRGIFKMFAKFFKSEKALHYYYYALSKKFYLSGLDKKK